jgi:2-isopropylmalate synthase
MRQVEIFDTTLRDGEQAPGAALTAAAKLEVARALADLGVDVIEAGFPAASDGEAAAVRQIAQDVTGVTMAALARANDGDVDAAAKALAPAQRKRIHVFIGTSDIHLERKLRITPHECLLRVERAVHRAMEHADEVEFSAEDATRTDIHFLGTVYQVAAAAGARIMNIPDTVGYAQPDEFARTVLAIRGALTAYNGGIRVSVHCHNDLGLAVANTLAAIEVGASQAHVTMNGIGERGGNASLEETVMALRCRTDWYGADTKIRTERIVPTSRLVSERTGIMVQPNKAVVGGTAVAPAAGIPPGRRDQGPADLRDHDPGVRRLGVATHRRVEAFGTCRSRGAARGARRPAARRRARQRLPPRDAPGGRGARARRARPHHDLGGVAPEGGHRTGNASRCIMSA